AVNFRRGANPPREEWREPPQRPPDETEAAYRRFEKYLDFQLSLPGVKHVTASELPAIYKNRIGAEGADLATVADVAEKIARAGGEAAPDRGRRSPLARVPRRAPRRVRRGARARAGAGDRLRGRKEDRARRFPAGRRLGGPAGERRRPG